MWNGNVNANNKDNNNNYVWAVRAGEWLPPLFSFENLYKQYLVCRRHKRNTCNALKFEIDAETRLVDLSRELTNKVYSPSRSVCFLVSKPKMREIIAADFRDRVVHHLLVERLELIYERIFIYDSYACRHGKGIHKAISRLRDFIRKGSRNGTERLFFLHLDIKNFFMTIDKVILRALIERKVHDPELLSLARVIIDHNPIEACILKRKKEQMTELPPHKSLFSAPPGKGLPIGNLTSQFFANVYLNELDQYVKHVLKMKYYMRYCDDLVLLHIAPEVLREAGERITSFVGEKLALSMNDRYGNVLPVGQGIDFLGYVVRSDYTLVRRRAVNNLKEKLRWFEKRLLCEKDGIKTAFFDYTLLERLRSVLASYLGHFSWADTYNLKIAVFRQFRFLNEYFGDVSKGLKPLYRFKKAFSSLVRQVGYFRWVFRGHVVFIQVGARYRQYVSGVDGYSATGCDDVRVLAAEHAARGVPSVIISERESYIGRVKERLPAMKISAVTGGI